MPLYFLGNNRPSDLHQRETCLFCVLKHSNPSKKDGLRGKNLHSVARWKQLSPSPPLKVIVYTSCSELFSWKRIWDLDLFLVGRHLISAILLKHPTFESGFFKFSWAKKNTKLEFLYIIVFALRIYVLNFLKCIFLDFWGVKWAKNTHWIVGCTNRDCSPRDLYIKTLSPLQVMLFVSWIFAFWCSQTSHNSFII